MFLELMDLYRTLDLKFNSVDSSHLENNFKQTINYPGFGLMRMSLVRRTYRRYHCSVTYVIQQRRSYHQIFSLIVT